LKISKREERGMDSRSLSGSFRAVALMVFRHANHEKSTPENPFPNRPFLIETN